MPKNSSAPSRTTAARKRAPAKPAAGRGAGRRADDRLLASLLQNLPGMVYRCRGDAPWAMTFASEGARELTGWGAEELVAGKPGYASLILPEDVEVASAAVREALARRAPYTLEYRIRCADGSVKWVWERGRGLPDRGGEKGLREGALRDITPRKLAEQALADSEARFRAFAELSGDWLWETDAEHRYTWISQDIERVVGRPPAFYLGRTRFEIAIASGVDLAAEPWASHMRQLERREPFRDFVQRRVVPRGELWLRMSGVPRFAPDGAFLGYRAAVTDVTAQVAAEQGARQANERLRAALDGLNEAIAVTDAEDRIVVTNRHFRALNQNTQLVDPGRRYEEHLRAGIAIGNYPAAAGREEAWIAERLAARQRGGTIEVQRQDGRWLQVTDQRLPDGGMITFALDITERKRAELALAESEARFRDFANASGDWFWETDTEDRMLWVSESVSRFAGLGPETFVGRTRTEVARERGVDVDGPGWQAQFEYIRRRESYRDLRHVRVDNQGRRRVLQVSAVPRFDAKGAFAGYRGAVTDATVQAEMEARAREADALLRAAIDDIDASISITDAEDRIVMANRMFRTLNFLPDFVEGTMRYEELLRHGIAAGRMLAARGCEDEWLAARMAHRRRGGVLVVERSDGRWLQVHERPLPGGGIVTHTVDVTALKHAEAALRDANASLEQRIADATVELRVAYRELESFSYSVSHDLRAPLRAISGFAGILREEEGERLSEDGRRYLATIDASAQQMGRLVDALLELVRTSRHAITGAPLDMNAIAREVCVLLTAEYPAARVLLHELPPASGDATLVRQVLVNLVGNALKYSSRAGSPEVVIGSSTEAGGRRWYTVRDNGIGFDMRYADKLFKPFERLHADPGFQGTGIGLALASLIVHRHGGRIEADSAPGEGATFRFTLGAA